MDFATKEIVLYKTRGSGGIKAILSERTAGNVYNLSEAANGELTGVEVLLIQCKGIEHALKENIREVPEYRFGDFFRLWEIYKARKYVLSWNRKFTTKYLFKYLRISQIIALTKELTDLEGLEIDRNGQKKNPSHFPEIQQTPS